MNLAKLSRQRLRERTQRLRQRAEALGILSISSFWNHEGDKHVERWLAWWVRCVDPGHAEDLASLWRFLEQGELVPRPGTGYGGYVWRGVALRQLEAYVNQGTAATLRPALGDADVAKKVTELVQAQLKVDADWLSAPVEFLKRLKRVQVTAGEEGAKWEAAMQEYGALLDVIAQEKLDAFEMELEAGGAAWRPFLEDVRRVRAQGDVALAYRSMHAVKLLQIVEMLRDTENTDHNRRFYVAHFWWFHTHLSEVEMKHAELYRVADANPEIRRMSLEMLVWALSVDDDVIDKKARLESELNCANPSPEELEWTSAELQRLMDERRAAGSAPGGATPSINFIPSDVFWYASTSSRLRLIRQIQVVLAKTEADLRNRAEQLRAVLERLDDDEAYREQKKQKVLSLFRFMGAIRACMTFCREVRPQMKLRMKDDSGERQKEFKQVEDALAEMEEKVDELEKVLTSVYEDVKTERVVVGCREGEEPSEEPPRARSSDRKGEEHFRRGKRRTEDDDNRCK